MVLGRAIPREVRELTKCAERGHRPARSTLLGGGKLDLMPTLLYFIKSKIASIVQQIPFSEMLNYKNDKLLTISAIKYFYFL